MAPFADMIVQDNFSSNSEHLVYNDACEQKTLQKSVRFSSCLLDTQSIMNRYDYTSEEKEACWFTTKDKQSSNKRRIRIIKRMEAGKAPKSSQTYRGLVDLTMEGGERLDTVLGAHVDAVMDEQDRQWESGQDDYEKIAEITMQLSVSAKQRALQVALLDEQDAKLAWDQELSKKKKKKKISSKKPSSKRHTKSSSRSPSRTIAQQVFTEFSKSLEL